LLEKIVEDLADVGFVEAKPLMEGRAMVMIIAPRKDVKATDQDEDSEESESYGAEARPTEARAREVPGGGAPAAL
jgi:translation initiation factor IF-3